MSNNTDKTLNLIAGKGDSVCNANYNRKTHCCYERSAKKPEDFNPVQSLGIAFGISVLLVVLISYVKYRLDKVSGFKENMMFYSELPIDANTVVITILVTYYDKVSNMGVLFFFMFLSIILSLIMTSLRRALLNNVENNERWTYKGFFCIAGEYLLLLLSIRLIFNVII